MDLQKQLQEINSERIALDQMYIESIKSQLILRKQLLLLENEVSELKEKNSELEKNLQDLRDKSCEKEIAEILNEK